jgi:uncharacterized protein YneF (UPF0154 family)
MFLILWGVVALLVGMVLGSAFERNRIQTQLWQRARPDVDDPKRLRIARNSDGLADPQQIEQALNAIAVEVERIGEGQRFLTKLLADKEPPGRR